MIDDGVTGFVVDDVPGAVRAVQRVTDIDRRRCRETFERKCSPDPISRDDVIRGIVAAGASDEQIRPTRDRAAA